LGKKAGVGTALVSLRTFTAGTCIGVRIRPKIDADEEQDINPASQAYTTQRESLVIRTRQITQNSYLDFLRTILCSKHTSVAGNNPGAVDWFVKYAGLQGDACFSTANRKNPVMTVSSRLLFPPPQR
jgi:hypothetical protein